MHYLKADTLTKVLIGPVVAVGDGFTPVTTLAVSTADEAELLKHDAAAVTDISSNTFAAVTGADGYYNLTITAAQLDTEGRLTVVINDDSLCLPVRHDFMVVSANVFDSLFAAATTDYLQTDATQLAGQTITAGAGVTFPSSVASPTNITSVASTALDSILASSTFALAMADAVWDEVLTGATHNVATSAGRRLRGVQDNQAYDDGAIWIDTVNGTAGTTVYENGTSGNPVDTLADALTLATAANVKHLHIVNGSTITLASAVDNFEMTGDEWGIALGGQSCDQSSIHNAHLPGVGVTGTFAGNLHLLHSTIGAITGPNARIGWCAITGSLTSNGTGTWVIHSCWGLSGAQFDFGAGGAQTIYITDWVGGPLTIANMAAGDVLYFEGRSAALTLAASCTAGTVYLAGDIALTNSGSGQTINQSSRYEITRILSDSTAFQGADIGAILTDTAEIGAAGAGLTNLGGSANNWNTVVPDAAGTAATLHATTDGLITTVDTVVDAILVDTAEIGIAGAGLTNLGGSANNWNTVVPDAAGTAATPADILTTALTEAYAADGAAPTLSQAVFLVMQHLSESSITGTIKTVKKLDGAATAATFTLDDATTPTSITRAT